MIPEAGAADLKTPMQPAGLDVIHPLEVNVARREQIWFHAGRSVEDAIMTIKDFMSISRTL